MGLGENNHGAQVSREERSSTRRGGAEGLVRERGVAGEGGGPARVLIPGGHGWHEHVGEGVVRGEPGPMSKR